MPGLAEGRSSSAAVALNGKLYVVSGYIGPDLYSTSTVECYDSAQNKWQFVANVNIARNTHRCCVINGDIYAVGGLHTNSLEDTTTIEKYDVQKNKWEIVSVSVHFIVYNNYNNTQRFFFQGSI